MNKKKKIGEHFQIIIEIHWIIKIALCNIAIAISVYECTFFLINFFIYFANNLFLFVLQSFIDFIALNANSWNFKVYLNGRMEKR